MAKVKVKICGITNWADAKSASDAGADFLGFNFYPRSPRYIRPATARKIVRRLPKGLSTVGVFVNETERNMLKIAQAVGLDYLQLHGDESAEMVMRLGRQVPVIKAVRVSKSFRVPQLAEFKRSKALLLDAFQRKLPGGTGRTFDWNIAHRARRYGRVFLAGGLTPENIGEAIRIGKPFAVDVCSGVEAAPGKKDPARIKALMSAARPSAGRPAAKRVVHSMRKGTR